MLVSIQSWVSVRGECVGGFAFAAHAVHEAGVGGVVDRAFDRRGDVECGEVAPDGDVAGGVDVVVAELGTQAVGCEAVEEPAALVLAEAVDLDGCDLLAS